MHIHTFCTYKIVRIDTKSSQSYNELYFQGKFTQSKEIKKN